MPISRYIQYSCPICGKKFESVGPIDKAKVEFVEHVITEYNNIIHQLHQDGFRFTYDLYKDIPLINSGLLCLKEAK